MGGGNDDDDTLTGGDNQDMFAVTWVSGNAPVLITDFQALSEEFRVLPEDDGSVPGFGIRDAAGGAGLRVVVGGGVVATLDNDSSPWGCSRAMAAPSAQPLFCRPWPLDRPKQGKRRALLPLSTLQWRPCLNGGLAAFVQINLAQAL